MHRDEQSDATLGGDRDDVVGTHPILVESHRETPGGRVEFPIGESRAGGVAQRDDVGMGRDRGIQQIHERRLGAGRGGRTGLQLPKGVDLVGVEEIDGVHTDAWVGRHRVHHPGEICQESLCRRPIEQIGRVLQRDGQLTGGGDVDGGEGEIELRRGRGERFEGRRDAEELAGYDIEGQIADGDLEERVPAGHPRRCNPLDDLLEPDVGVVEGGQVGLADPGQQLVEAGSPGDVGPQHLRADEEADQVVESRVGASGDRGAQRDVVTGAQPVQGHGHRGLHQHEHAGAGGPGDSGEPTAQVRSEEDGLGRGGARGARPTGTITRQRQFFGEIGQGVGPVAQLIVGDVIESASVPQRVIGVLHR